MGPIRLDHIESRRVLGWLISAWIVLAVLALDPSGFSPFGPIKWLVVSSLLPAAAVFAFSGKVVVHKKAMIAWAVLLVWVALAALLGVDKFHAWFGTPTRRFGVHGWALCALAFAVGNQVVLKRQGQLVHKALIVAGLGLGLYGILEVANFAPVELAQFTNRLGSTYGSPAYLGAAAALFFPAIAGISTSFEGRWRTIGFLSATSVLFVGLASGTRAAWVGLAVTGLIIAVVARRVLVLKPSLLAGGLLAAVVSVVATPVGPRLLDALDFSEGTSRGRLAEWRVGLTAVADRPFSGAGPEGYRVVFSESVSQSYAQTYGRSQIVDRAHNGLIDVAVTIGIPGLVLVIALLVIVGRVVFAAFTSRDPVLVGTGAGLLAYLVQQQFLFPVAEIDPLAWFIAGTLIVRVGQTHEFTSLSIPSVPLRNAVLACFGLLAALGGVYGVLDVVADRRANDALSLARSGELARGQELAQSAGQLRPDSILYAAVESEVNRLAGSPEGIEAALEANSRGLRYSPQDPGLLAGRGALLIAAARFDATEDSAQVAVNYWERLTNSDLNNGRFQLQLGAAYIGLGDNKLAEEAWIRSSELSPRSVEPRVNLGILYLGQNRVEEARFQLETARMLDPDNPSVAQLEEAVNAAG